MIFRLVVCCCVVIFAACSPLIPATTPPQLRHTPGAYVVIDDQTMEIGVFQVGYPAGWRVVKNSIAASASVSVVFVSPDDTMTIYISVVSVPCESPTPTPGNITRYDVIQAQAGDYACITGTAPENQEDEFQAAWEQVIESLRNS